MQKNQFLNVTNTFFKLGKDFIKLKDRWLKGRELKTKGEKEVLFFKQNTVSIDDIDKFQQKEMKIIGPIKKNCFEPIRSSVGGFKDKVVSLFNTDTSKQIVFGEKKVKLKID